MARDLESSKFQCHKRQKRPRYYTTLKAKETQLLCVNGGRSRGENERKKERERDRKEDRLIIDNIRITEQM